MTKPNLNQLLSALSADFVVHVVPPAGAVANEQLHIELPNDAAGRTRVLELIFLPHADDVHFLQFFVMLPTPVAVDRLNEVARIIARINSTAPLPGFCLLEDISVLCFRCLMPCPNHSLDTEIVMNTVYLTLYMLDHLGPVVEGVASGQVSLPNAINLLKPQVEMLPDP